MNKKTWLLVVTLAPVFLTACLLASEPRENCAESHDPRNTRTLRICTDNDFRDMYEFGESVYITFTVTNISDERLVLDGGDKPALDICILRECWSDRQELTPKLTRVTLEPGESRILTWTWPTTDIDRDEMINDYGAGELTFWSFHAHGVEIPLPGATKSGVHVLFNYNMLE